MLHEIMKAPDRESALEDMARFVAEFTARYPKAVATLTKDQDQLLTFSDFPAEHWIHLRTSNPVESPFATVKARTKVTKGAGSRKAGTACSLVPHRCTPLLRLRSTTFDNISVAPRAGRRFGARRSVM
jgi:hypothetical protein